jgi:hypothetical protein
MAELTVRRNEIVDQIRGIQSMRKGTLNATWRNVTHKDGEVVVKGPYYKLSRKGVRNKTFSWSIPTTQVETVRAEVDNYKKFRELADEYVDVCEQISSLSQTQKEQNGVKKN